MDQEADARMSLLNIMTEYLHRNNYIDSLYRNFLRTLGRTTLLAFWKLYLGLTNQNATQFENTESEKGPGRERRHERGKNKVTDANATTEAELCKSFKLR